MLAVKERIDTEFKMHENIGRKIGREEGKEEGKAEGRKEEAINLAKKMYKEKINVETIVKITGIEKEKFVKV